MTGPTDPEETPAVDTPEEAFREACRAVVVGQIEERMGLAWKVYGKQIAPPVPALASGDLRTEIAARVAERERAKGRNCGDKSEWAYERADIALAAISPELDHRDAEINRLRALVLEHGATARQEASLAHRDDLERLAAALTVPVPHVDQILLAVVRTMSALTEARAEVQMHADVLSRVRGERDEAHEDVARQLDQAVTAEAEVERLRGVVREYHAQALATAEQLGRESDRRAASSSPVETQSAATALYYTNADDAYYDLINMTEEIGARSPGWYRVTCDDCDPEWYTTGLESICEEAGYGHVADHHVAPTVPAEPVQAEPRQPRVWHEGDPEPEARPTVRGKTRTWKYDKSVTSWIATTGMSPWLDWPDLVRLEAALTEVVEQAPAGQDGA